MLITTSGLDLSDMTDAADHWLMSMNETEAWEQMRESCLHDEAVRLIRERAALSTEH